MLYKKIFEKLNSANIKYLVAGGMAVNLHGYVRGTMDLDILLLLKEENIADYIKIVKELGYKPRVPVALDDFLDANKRKDWIENKGMKVFCVYNPECDFEQIDVMIDPELEIEDFFNKKVVINVHGLKVPVVSIPDLISMKSKAGRSIDLIDIDNLNEIREMGESYG